MSLLKSTVGSVKLEWQQVPRSLEGTVHCKGPAGDWLEVRWRRDADGIWLILPHGVFGFDLQAQKDEQGRTIYLASQRNSHKEWNDLSCLYGEFEPQTVQRAGKTKAARVRAQMPGKIIRIMAKLGEMVQKDQPIVVMEAMKMENEIRAVQSGKVTQIKVVEGQAVETGADLVFIEV